MIDFVFWLIIYAAIAYGISTLLAPKPEKPVTGQTKIQFPTATECRPFPVLFGTRMIRGINAISPLLYKYSHYEQTKDTAANFYYASFHIGVVICLDGVKQIWIGGTCAWPTQNPDYFAGDGIEMAVICAPFLWGDWAYGGPGGIDGTVDILYGKSYQLLNYYLENKSGSNQPFYKNFVSMVFRGPTLHYNTMDIYGGMYIGTAPVIKQIEILGKRTEQFNDRTEMWYKSKVNIGPYNDMNPAHIVYEMITSNIIGRGTDKELIGESFAIAADKFYEEDLGLSCIWDWAPDEIGSMIEQIERIVDGKIYFSLETEKYEFGLNRPVDPEGLEEFDESDFWIESAGYISPCSIPNKVMVLWEHRIYEGKRMAYDDDIALVHRQSGIINVEEYDYSFFVCDGNLANKIASRNQYAFSSMPKRFTLRCLRTMSHLHETSVFKISYPSLNITSMLVRLVSIDRGSLTDDECIIECIEDVFGQAYTIYG